MARASRNAGRRAWRVPPPLEYRSEPADGLAILTEIPGDLGGFLWRSLSSVMLWARTPPVERQSLFTPEAEDARAVALLTASIPSDLETVLPTFVEVIAHSESVAAERVALACRAVAGWAARENARGTELAFLQGTAFSTPGDPKSAVAFARALRDRGEYAHAEAWLARAIGLARQVLDWETYTRAHLSLARAYYLRGSLAHARRHLERARRTARRRGLREAHAMAAHDLSVLVNETGSTEEAMQLAGEALRGYGPHHPNLLRLAVDIAYAWLERGRTAPALVLLRIAVPHLPREARPSAYGSLARAAGVEGDEETFLWAAARVRRSPDAAPAKAAALGEVAQGALALGRIQEAEQAAHAGGLLARSRREGKILLTNDAILAAVRASDAAARRSDIPQAATSSEMDLVHEFQAVLSGS